MVGGIGAGEAEERGTRVKKVAALHFADRPDPGAPAVVFWDDDAFFLPFPERGYTLFSFFCDEWDCLPESASLSLTAEDREQGVTYVSRRNPDLAGRYCGGRAFCDAYPRDATPFVARNGSGRLLAVGGCSGSGIRVAPALADAAVEDVRKLLTCVP